MDSSSYNLNSSANKSSSADSSQSSSPQNWFILSIKHFFNNILTPLFSGVFYGSGYFVGAVLMRKYLLSMKISYPIRWWQLRLNIY
jgi:hypothetical protein